MEALKKQIDEGMASLKTLVTEQVGKVAEDVKGISERVEKLEKLPAAGAPNLNLKFVKEFKGYNMEKQGLGTLNKIRGREHLFPALPTKKRCTSTKMVHHLREGNARGCAVQDGTAGNAAEDRSRRWVDSIGGYLVPDEFQPISSCSRVTCRSSCRTRPLFR